MGGRSARALDEALVRPVDRESEPFPGAQTSALCGLTSVFSGLTLLGSIIASSGPLVPLGMFVSESRACLKRLGGSRQG